MPSTLPRDRSRRPDPHPRHPRARRAHAPADAGAGEHEREPGPGRPRDRHGFRRSWRRDREWRAAARGRRAAATGSARRAAERGSCRAGRAAERWRRGGPVGGQEAKRVGVAEPRSVAACAEVQACVASRCGDRAEQRPAVDRRAAADRDRGERHLADAPDAAAQRDHAAARPDPARDEHRAGAWGADRRAGCRREVGSAVAAGLERVRAEVEPAHHRPGHRRAPRGAGRCRPGQDSERREERGEVAGVHPGDVTGESRASRPAWPHRHEIGTKSLHFARATRGATRAAPDCTG